MLSFVVGGTVAEAQRNSRELDEWIDDDAVIAQFGGSIGIDLGQFDPDSPLDDLHGVGVQSLISLLRGVAGDRPATLRDVVATRKRTRKVGTPEQIADRIEQWYQAGVDGISISNALRPDDYRNFAEEIAPILANRGLIAADRAGDTPASLRRNLFGADRLSERHPAAQYRDGFSGASIADEFHPRTPGLADRVLPR
jgi:alkanesulfonate monooxygenase SsuD/methylene tetrahydromethanopterin reductase-like flavin-dependent oxidoreductase (luciferase family)